MLGRRFSWLVYGVTAAVVVSCNAPAETAPTAPPPPATEAEMAEFCEAYDEVRGQSWGELTAALIDVSPLEIRAQMVRSSQPPGDGWEVDRAAVEDFLERCNQ